MLDINRGDQFDYLVSMSSKAPSLNDYARRYDGEHSPYSSRTSPRGKWKSRSPMRLG